MPRDVPCTRSPWLFESESLFDHLEAKRICLTECKHRLWCKQQLEEAQREVLVPGFGPSGTWAGKLYRSAEQRKRAG